MCGIFGIVSKPIDLERLTSGTERLPELEDGLGSLQESLSTLSFYLLHQAYSSAAARDHWQSLQARLQQEEARPEVDPSQAQIYRDLAWRIEHDLLDLLASMSSLLEDPDYALSGTSIWLAWQVELTLRALGRLEVRGRDSAGLSVMLWFADEAARNEVFQGSTECPDSSCHAVQGTACLTFTYRVAEEVGALGYNEATLRDLIRADTIFRQAISESPWQSKVLAHTRWASNGIISLENTHPIDGSLKAGEGAGFPAGRTLGVLNGDVDNFLSLIPDLTPHGAIPQGVTTDAKVIPALVEVGLSHGRDMDSSSLDMMGQLEGSVAIVLTRADAPGVIWCGLKGTGQALYLADAGDAVLVASEVYGSAELTENYWPLELAQERQADGHEPILVKIDMTTEQPRFHRLSGEKPTHLTPAFRTAEITTRDVDRRGFTHYFRKELEEAILSVEKTIHGRYTRTTPTDHEGEPEVEFSNLYSDLKGSDLKGSDEKDSDIKEGLFDAIVGDNVRRIVFVGQGSAHVAGQVGTHLLAEILRHDSVTCEAMTAGDFSAHELRADLSDTCLVALSQSGTTTDTNRCLALARGRGARVIGIVNRRNSALVELCDAVIYTSDGRDIEMAVASTKAFYSQVVASFMLAQHIGLLRGALIADQVAAALIELERLPSVMQAAFEIEPQVAECARAVALKRRHWSVLGTGASLATGEEIRIKFSELCYKSVSVDILENKKHIDLSSEPLILAALHDLRSDLVGDAVKEVSIFSAHRAITVVMCDRDGDLYRHHTDHVLEMPPIGHGLGAVTTALVGHLFAYHTAVAMDEVAQRLRRLRKGLLHSASSGGRRPIELAAEAQSLLADLLRGDLDALWPAKTAGRMAATFQLLVTDVGMTAPASSLLLLADDEADDTTDIDEWARNQLSTAIADSTRSIDSIRHQAKTITVGTSRSGYSESSAMGKALDQLGVAIEHLPLSLHSALTAIDDLLEEVPSGIRYSVSQLPSANGSEEIHLTTATRLGLAEHAISRFDKGAPLAGTKLTSVRRRQPMVVQGIRDGAQLLVFPILEGGKPVEVVLLHLALSDDISEAQKVRFLEAFPQRAEQLIEHFGEILGRQVDLKDLARLDPSLLLFSPPAVMKSSVLA